jgi:8-oxo-dGTP pyrophosphatase MutT (NUDIX family)/GNAT superfamily N-acetyltransferase
MNITPGTNIPSYNFTVQEVTQSDRLWMRNLLEDHWGSAQMVTRGKVHQADELPGFIAWVEGERRGLITYNIEALSCEIVSLDSLRHGLGIGTALISAVREVAISTGCHRLWMVTTNDNTPAMRFYLRGGFELAAIHRGAIYHSRELKPSIPHIGNDGIPITDEVEFEMSLRNELSFEKPHFPQRVDRRTIYESEWVNLYLDSVIFPDGKFIDRYHMLDFPKQAVAALVQDQDGKLLFERVYRYPTGRMEWEVPAGGIEPGEDILETAQREIFEETGFTSHQHKLLYSFFPANGNTNIQFHLVSCQAGDRSGNMDEGEIFEIRWMSRTEIQELLHTGELKDGFTLSAVLYWWWIKEKN